MGDAATVDRFDVLLVWLLPLRNNLFISYAPNALFSVFTFRNGKDGLEKSGKEREDILVCTQEVLSQSLNIEARQWYPLARSADFWRAEPGRLMAVSMKVLSRQYKES